MSSYKNIKVIGLKPGMENVNIVVRVLEAGEPRIIQTRAGLRTISEAVVGDESGRVKLILWGRHAGKVKAGQVLRINGAWVTAYRGIVQLNVGSRGKITEEDIEFSDESSIPTSSPKAETTGRRFTSKGMQRGRKSRSWRR